MFQSKKELIYEYLFSNPIASITDCYNALNCSRQTVLKWYKSFVREHSALLQDADDLLDVDYEDDIVWGSDSEYCGDLCEENEDDRRGSERPEAVDYFGLEILSFYPMENLERKIEEANSDTTIATLLAVISNKTKLVAEEIRDSSKTSKTRDSLLKEFNAWSEIEWNLYKKVYDYLNIRVDVGYRDDMLQSYRKKIRMFMNRNGYVEESGWWIKGE